jgi:hypothetical protein
MIGQEVVDFKKRDEAAPFDKGGSSLMVFSYVVDALQRVCLSEQLLHLGQMLFEELECLAYGLWCRHIDACFFE